MRVIEIDSSTLDGPTTTIRQCSDLNPGVEEVLYIEYHRSGRCDNPVYLIKALPNGLDQVVTECDTIDELWDFIANEKSNLGGNNGTPSRNGTPLL